MPTSRFKPFSIKNKVKRQEIARKRKRQKVQDKLRRRLVLAKAEVDDPLAKKKRKEQNTPRTLDNTRVVDPSYLTSRPRDPYSLPEANELAPSAIADEQLGACSHQQLEVESSADLSHDAFASYFSGDADPNIPPKVLITTSPRATSLTHSFCDELVTILPGAELIRRKKGKFEIGRIAGWAAGRSYSHMLVVNEDTKKPNALTMIYLPNGPTAYFKLTSVELSKTIHGHARTTDHFPELVLNGFVTRLGHTVGRLFQTLFPSIPEFQGRQVVTLHNQRDFLFFRRHRYAFRSTEKVALQEIGPRFTLKLRSLKKGLPVVAKNGDQTKLEFDAFGDDSNEKPKYNEVVMNGGDMESNTCDGPGISGDSKTPQHSGNADEFLWIWKPELETTRRTFFL